MKQVRARVVQWGSQINLWLVVGIIVILNRSWMITLGSFDAHFRAVSGFPLLDLQNDLDPERIMTPTRALQQIASYSQEAKTLYWSFFILDNIMPQLTFLCYSLLWVYFLRSQPNRLYQRLLHSPFVLIPIGVGVFDWFENLGYVAAMHTSEPSMMQLAIVVGLTFKWLKVACIFATFWGLAPMIVYHLYSVLRQRIRHRARVQPR